MMVMVMVMVMVGYCWWRVSRWRRLYSVSCCVAHRHRLRHWRQHSHAVLLQRNLWTQGYHRSVIPPCLSVCVRCLESHSYEVGSTRFRDRSETPLDLFTSSRFIMSHISTRDYQQCLRYRI